MQPTDHTIGTWGKPGFFNKYLDELQANVLPLHPSNEEEEVESKEEYWCDKLVNDPVLERARDAVFNGTLLQKDERQIILEMIHQVTWHSTPAYGTPESFKIVPNGTPPETVNKYFTKNW